MESTLNRQKCSAVCREHMFELKSLRRNTKFDVSIGFCPKYRREPHPP